MIEGLASPRGLAPETLVYRPRDFGMERSVQFNLLTLETAHHGKRTLGDGNGAIRSRPAKGV